MQIVIHAFANLWGASHMLPDIVERDFIVWGAWVVSMTLHIVCFANASRLSWPHLPNYSPFWLCPCADQVLGGEEPDSTESVCIAVASICYHAGMLSKRHLVSRCRHLKECDSMHLFSRLAKVHIAELLQWCS